MATERSTFLLDETQIPTQWYNLVPDLPAPPPPPLHPATHEPVGPDALAPLFPDALIAQEVSGERYIDIPDEVQEVYRLWRPSPLYRALRLEKALGTPARIYYKYEGVSPAGSHKPNTAVPQAFYNAQAGIRRLTTETGAGQWGTALAFACGQFDVNCDVWWVGASYDQKPYRKTMMEMFGATVHRSPSPDTAIGRAALAEDPHSLGSIGLAVSEAVEVALQDRGAGYALGSVASHVLLHQTIIGREALAQLELAEDYPDVLISCVGGGSGIGGLAFPFLPDKLSGRRDVKIVAAEPSACPSMTRGRYAWDYGDKQGLTPLMKMYTLGHGFVPAAIHAGGLRYHGVAPLVSAVAHQGLMEAMAIPQTECFEAGMRFARTEGIIPAPESTHAVAAAIEHAERAKQTRTETVIVVLITGHAHFDLSAYESFRDGGIHDEVVTDQQLEAFLSELPDVPEPDEAP
jgi:tryptophan synthase beta chain